MNASSQVFTLGPEGLKRRKLNVLYGAALSLFLVGLVGWEHLEQPQTYNAALLWSIVGFVILANGIGFWRHLRYLKLAKEHSLEIRPGGISFHTGDKSSKLSLLDISAVTVYRNKEGIGHLQIRRRDERGIRLEGYSDMDALIAALKGIVPPAQWIND